MVILSWQLPYSTFSVLQGPAREREKREKERSELRDLVTLLFVMYKNYDSIIDDLLYSLHELNLYKPYPYMYARQ